MEKKTSTPLVLLLDISLFKSASGAANATALQTLNSYSKLANNYALMVGAKIETYDFLRIPRFNLPDRKSVV